MTKTESADELKCTLFYSTVPLNERWLLFVSFTPHPALSEREKQKSAINKKVAILSFQAGSIFYSFLTSSHNFAHL